MFTSPWWRASACRRQPEQHLVSSSYAVISYTENAFYVAFAATGSWVGAYASITFLHRPGGGPPVGAAPE
jgi:hypothetical protein